MTNYFFPRARKIYILEKNILFSSGIYIYIYIIMNKNIYGEELKSCRNNDNDNDDSGSWDLSGNCSDRGMNDPGVHQICFFVDSESKNFSQNTGQSNWSETTRMNKHHCMCLGAYSLYKTKMRQGEINSHNSKVKCEAIPESALSDKYLSNWKKWNGLENEYKLDINYKKSLDELYIECKSQAPNANGLQYLDGLYTNIKL